MAKQIKTIVKLQILAGKATAAPPVGTALGPHGINLGDFVSRFNSGTADRGTDIVPVEVTIYQDRTFDLVFKTAPASDLLRKAAGVEKGSGKPLQSKVGSITEKQLEEIATKKMVDLNANDTEAAKKIIAGTARSMGIEIKKKSFKSDDSYDNLKGGYFDVWTNTRLENSLFLKAGSVLVKQAKLSCSQRGFAYLVMMW